MKSSDCALIIIDVQNDFMEKGSLETPNAKEILPHINNIRKKFQTIFLTQDYHPKNHISFAETHKAEPFSFVKTEQGDQIVVPSHCVQSTLGCEFHKELEKAEWIYENYDSFSGFGVPPEKTKLDELLKEKGIKNLFLVGLVLEYCVRDTAIDAKNLGLLCFQFNFQRYQVYIVKDGTKPFTKQGQNETLELIKKKNIHYIEIDEIEKFR